jgi:hypothetical protein
MSGIAVRSYNGDVDVVVQGNSYFFAVLLGHSGFRLEPHRSWRGGVRSQTRDCGRVEHGADETQIEASFCAAIRTARGAEVDFSREMGAREPGQHEDHGPNATISMQVLT